MSSRYVQPLRIVIQWCFLGFMLWLGIRLYLFVSAVVSGTAIPMRPAGVDGFLPIAGFMGTVAWVKGLGINPIHPAAVVIFVTILTISWTLRRSFCSWICPVATLSELTWKGGFKLSRRVVRLPGWLDCVLRVFKYLFMAFFVVIATLKMSSDELQAFLASDFHKIADVRLLEFFLKISPRASGIIILLLLFSMVLRNPFCRYLCPYGALLGLLAMFSPLRVTRDVDRCVSCGACSQACPSAIDVMHKHDVASPECIGCWRCISYCRFNEALSMRAFRKYRVSGILFALLLLTLFIGATMWAKKSGYWHSMVTQPEYIRLLAK